jgi:hypothetical protein
MTLAIIDDAARELDLGYGSFKGALLDFPSKISADS